MPDAAQAFSFEPETARRDGAVGCIRILNELATLRERLQHCVYVRDSLDGRKIPKGQARNHCLDVWDSLIREDPAGVNGITATYANPRKFLAQEGGEFGVPLNDKEALGTHRALEECLCNRSGTGANLKHRRAARIYAGSHKPRKSR